jgi:hypothetical protein
MRRLLLIVACLSLTPFVGCATKQWGFNPGKFFPWAASLYSTNSLADDRREFEGGYHSPTPYEDYQAIKKDVCN